MSLVALQCNNAEGITINVLSKLLNRHSLREVFGVAHPSKVPQSRSIVMLKPLITAVQYELDGPPFVAARGMETEFTELNLQRHCDCGDGQRNHSKRWRWHAVATGPLSGTPPTRFVDAH